MYNRYLHLKFKRVIANKSHTPLKGCIGSKSSRLIQMCWFLLKNNCPVSGHTLCTSLFEPPQCPTSRASCAPRRAPFSRRWQPDERKWISVNVPNANPQSAVNPCQWNARLPSHNSIFIVYLRAPKLLILVNRVTGNCGLSVFDVIC